MRAKEAREARAAMQVEEPPKKTKAEVEREARERDMAVLAEGKLPWDETMKERSIFVYLIYTNLVQSNIFCLIRKKNMIFSLNLLMERTLPIILTQKF